jgi:hypothetical protein
LFQTLSPGIFLFSSRRKEKKNKGKKTIKKKKKKQRREGVYFQALALPCHFWLLLLASCFCAFASNTFSWHVFLLKQKIKKKNTKKKNHKEEKTCREKRELTFLLSLLHLG